MTTVARKKVKCGCCGFVLEMSALGSTNTCGSMDLDTRPPEMMRSTMTYWLTRCPECGYVDSNIELCDKISKEVVKSLEYRSISLSNVYSTLCRNFLQFAMICARKNDKVGEVYSYLHAAWVCDDNHEIANAIALRKQCISLINELNIHDGNETFQVITAALLRRSGEFDLLNEEYEGMKFSDELLNKIIRFQLKKAKERNSQSFTVSDI